MLRLFYREDKQSLREPDGERQSLGPTPNMRALQLTIHIGDLLLSMGSAASDVVNLCLSVGDSYCARAVHVDVNHTMIMVSQDHGVEREPLTLFRTVKPRGMNFMMVQDIEQLVRDIKKGLPFEEAEKRIRTIVQSPAKYPKWALTCANAGVNVGVVLMFTSNPIVLVITFLIGVMVDRVMAMIARHGWPEFFVRVGAPMFITFSAATLAWLNSLGFQPFHGFSPTLVIVGGIIMLVAGLTIVSTAQDALDEYYVTASAKVLKTFMNTAGIIVGILVALSISRGIGAPISLSPDPIPLSPYPLPIIGAAVAAAAWSFYIQAHRGAVLIAGLVGGLAWVIYNVATTQFDMNAPTASGLGAVVIGFLAALTSRFVRTPTQAIMSGAIIPLVPGLMLYTGLMLLVSGQESAGHFVSGLTVLFTALSVALAIAAGVSFGNVLGRPIPRNILRARKLLSLSRSDMK